LMIALWVLLFERAPLVSGPHAVRAFPNTPTFDDWQDTFYPTQGRPWTGKIKESDLAIDSSADGLIVTVLSSLCIENQHFANSDNQWKPAPPVLHYAPRATQQVTLPDGSTLEIEAIFTAYPTGPGESNWVSGLFDPLTLAPIEPIAENGSPKIVPREEHHFFPQQEYPEMAFAVGGDLTHMLDFRLFDPKTHQPMKEVAGGFGSNVLTLPLRQWHSSPLMWMRFRRRSGICIHCSELPIPGQGLTKTPPWRGRDRRKTLLPKAALSAESRMPELARTPKPRPKWWLC